MENPPERSITELLGDVSSGDRRAFDQLMPLVYEELRRMAGSFMRRERAGITLQPTALVNEAYLRLIEQDRVEWQGRAHFLAIAAIQMKRILHDHARSKTAVKRGSGAQKISLDEELCFSDEPEPKILALNDALDTLGKRDARKAKIVTMRYYGGMKNEEIAEVLNVSTATVEREWKFARAWLVRELQ